MILVCEPQCKGLEHAEVNAAMIAVVKKALPSEDIIFFAEKEHSIYVNKALDSQSIRVSNRFLNIPHRNRCNLIMFPRESMIIRKVFTFAAKNGISRVLFCSITSPQLISIKTLSNRHKSIKCLIVLHSILETISKPPSAIIDLPFWLRIWMPLCNTRQIQFLVLGDPILNELAKELPTIKGSVHSIDLPYFYKNTFISNIYKNKIIKFGFFGVGSENKGFDLFIKLAKEIRNSKFGKRSEFILIGRNISKISKEELKDYVITPSSDKPLDRAKFDEIAGKIDYIILLHKARYYRFTASGVFFDALLYIKPIIAIKTSFFDYYFNKLGDIGYLCDNYEELRDVVLNIISTYPIDRYSNQQQELLGGRKLLDIDRISKRFAEIWDESELVQSSDLAR
jgi:glycosyltransferase involved in cell wall biosynthesis